MPDGFRPDLTLWSMSPVVAPLLILSWKRHSPQDRPLRRMPRRYNLLLFGVSNKLPHGTPVACVFDFSFGWQRSARWASCTSKNPVTFSAEFHTPWATFASLLPSYRTRAVNVGDWSPKSSKFAWLRGRREQQNNEVGCNADEYSGTHKSVHSRIDFVNDLRGDAWCYHTRSTPRAHSLTVCALSPPTFSFALSRWQTAIARRSLVALFSLWLSIAIIRPDDALIRGSTNLELSSTSLFS
jgi:hypothetical protein